MKLRGLAFESFRHPPRAEAREKPPTRAGLPAGHSYTAHCGSRQRLRYLRQVCHRVLRARDPDVRATLDRVKTLTATEPEPELGYLNLVAAAQEVACDTGVTWVAAAEYLVKKFKLREGVEEPLPPPEAPGA